jgi:hypothetical protein
VLVLAPLLPPTELSGLTATVAGELPDLAVGRRSLSMQALRALGPLTGRLSAPGGYADGDAAEG